MTAFWKPGTARPGSTLDRLSESEGVITTAKPKEAVGGIQGQRERLPIAKQRTKLLYMVQKHPVVIVVGQTGCGKTTRELIMSY
jgi:ATP-dependent RNA helicase DDX35